MDGKLKPGQRIPVVVELLDKNGKQTQFDGEPVWSISDETLAGFEIDENGTRYVKHLASGAVVVAVEGDADQGDGVQTVRFQGTLTLLGGDVVTGELKFGSAEDEPAPVPAP